MVSPRATAIITAALVATFANPVSARAAALKSIVTEKSASSTTKSNPPIWLEICKTLAPASSVLCSLAPLPTIFGVARDKSVGSLPLLSYSSMTANSMVWALYGWLSDIPTVKWPNILGTTLGLYYWKEYNKYCPSGASNLPGTMKHHIIVVTWLIFANAFVVSKFPKQKAADIIGKEAIILFIVLFASPLAALKTVLATKSAVSIPLPFTIACTINCLLWILVGLLLMNDFNLYFPPMVGFIFAVVQLFLKGIYGGGEGEIETVMLQELGKMETV